MRYAAYVAFCLVVGVALGVFSRERPVSVGFFAEWGMLVAIPIVCLEARRKRLRDE